MLVDMDDIWKPVPGLRNVEVSDAGEVRRGTKLLRPWLDTDGYLQISLRSGDILPDAHWSTRRRSLRVHELVLHAHLGPPPKNFTTYFVDHMRTNVALNNLRWTSRRGPRRPRYGSLTLAQIIEVASLLDSGLNAEQVAAAVQPVTIGPDILTVTPTSVRRLVEELRSLTVRSNGEPLGRP